jgi:F0F1-type ATP synthase delta subunit
MSSYSICYACAWVTDLYNKQHRETERSGNKMKVKIEITIELSDEELKALAERMRLTRDKATREDVKKWVDTIVYNEIGELAFEG